LSKSDASKNLKVSVDDEQCAQTGRCTFAAPEVFSYDDDGLMTFKEYASDDSRSALEDAVALCPMRAISVEDVLAEPSSK
jgi:ferredoxin